MKHVLSLILVLMLWSCRNDDQSNPFGPSGLPPTTRATEPEPAAVTPINPGIEIPDGVASASDIELVGLNRAGIRVKASCSGVVFFVPATGADYVNVWIPEIFGLKYGPNPVNEEFTLFFEPGTYRFQLAVEKKTGDPNHPIAQDDRHRGEFTVVCDRTPVPPPPPPPPVCEFNPQIPADSEECVPPPPNCEDVWVVDEEAWDEEVCEPGEPIVTGYAYKLTGGDPLTRSLRCHLEGGSYESTATIPGEGVVDACIFDEYPGSDDFLVGLFNPKTRFRLYFTITTPGEEVCETIHHEEEGHFEEVCEQ